MLDGKSRMVSVGHQVSSCIGSTTKIHENSPVILIRTQDLHVVPSAEIFDKVDRFIQWSWWLEYLGMGGDPQASAQGQLGNCHARASPHILFKPGTNWPVEIGIFTMRLHQNINVQQKH